MDEAEDAFSEILLCPKCRRRYCLDTGDPMVLRCGHNLCNECQITQSSTLLECPLCHATTDTSVYRFRKAYALKRIISKRDELKNVKAKPITFNENLNISMSGNSDESLYPLGVCQSHNSPVYFCCVTCEEWLCGTCVCVKHCGHSTACRVVLIKEALEIKRKELVDLLTTKHTSLKYSDTDVQLNANYSREFLNNIEELKAIEDNYSTKLDNKEQGLLRQEIYLAEFDPLVTELKDNINKADRPQDLMKALDKYFNSKKCFERELERNDIFHIWKYWIKRLTAVMEKINTVYVRWEDRNGEMFWLRLKTEKEKVFMNLIPYEKLLDVDAMKLEKHFFSFSSKLQPAFLQVSANNNRFTLTFLLDDNPLGQEFMKHCCLLRNSFKNSEIFSNRTNNYVTTVFGTRDKKNKVQLANIGAKEQYLKPFSIGAIGLLSSCGDDDETTIDVNNMEIYINREHDPPSQKDLPYIAYGDKPMLKLCCGFMYSEIGQLSLLGYKGTRYHILKCGVIADDVSDDEYDN